MVFTVSPGAHVRHPPGEDVGSAGVSLADSGVYSEDLSVFYYFGRAVTVDPFVSSVVDSVGDGGDGGLGFEPCLRDFWRGGDCKMDMDGPEWAMFCQDFLLLGDGGLRSQSGLVEIIDGLLNGVVFALTGCGEYGDRSAGSSACLMRFVGHLYVLMVLCGGEGVLPLDVAFGCYGGSVSGGGGLPCKMLRRLKSLGLCARGMICAAWPFGVWSVDTAEDEAVLHVLGLEHYLPRVPFWLVWRTAVVDRAEGLGLLMSEVVGPAFHGGHHSLVGHEYDFSDAADPRVGVVLGEVVHGCYALLVSRIGVEYGCSRKGVERMGGVWLAKMYGGFMRGGGSRLRADASVVQKLMALFSVPVKRGGRGSYSFCVGGRSVWEVHSVGSGEHRQHPSLANISHAR